MSANELANADPVGLVQRLERRLAAWRTHTTRLEWMPRRRPRGRTGPCAVGVGHSTMATSSPG